MLQNFYHFLHILDQYHGDDVAETYMYWYGEGILRWYISSFWHVTLHSQEFLTIQDRPNIVNVLHIYGIQELKNIIQEENDGGDGREHNFAINKIMQRKTMSVNQNSIVMQIAADMKNYYSFDAKNSYLTFVTGSKLNFF